MIAIETVINAYNKGSISKHAGLVFLLSPFNLKGVNDGEPSHQQCYCVQHVRRVLSSWNP